MRLTRVTNERPGCDAKWRALVMNEERDYSAKVWTKYKLMMQRESEGRVTCFQSIAATLGQSEQNTRQAIGRLQFPRGQVSAVGP